MPTPWQEAMPAGIQYTTNVRIFFQSYTSYKGQLGHEVCDITARTACFSSIKIVQVRTPKQDSYFGTIYRGRNLPVGYYQHTKNTNKNTRDEIMRNSRRTASRRILRRQQAARPTVFTLLTHIVASAFTGGMFLILAFGGALVVFLTYNNF